MYLVYQKDSSTYGTKVELIIPLIHYETPREMRMLTDEITLNKL